MNNVSNREEFITRLVVEPRIKRLLYELKSEMDNDQYFQLNQEEKKLVAKTIVSKSLDETAKLFMSTKKYNDPKFIYQLSINNLTTLNKIFEEVEMYCYCQMLTDALKILNDDLQELVREEL